MCSATRVLLSKEAVRFVCGCLCVMAAVSVPVPVVSRGAVWCGLCPPGVSASLVPAAVVLTSARLRRLAEGAAAVFEPAGELVLAELAVGLAVVSVVSAFRFVCLWTVSAVFEAVFEAMFEVVLTVRQ